MYSFSQEPKEVIDFLSTKRLELHFNYDEIMHTAHNTAFTVAKITRLDLLEDIQKSLVEAQKSGVGFKEWKRGIEPTLAQKGWLGNIEVANPLTGEIKSIQVDSPRLKNIFMTNARTAYAKTQFESIMNSDIEYIRYTSILDSALRPSHRALHGSVYPKNHPFWEHNFPPNSWGCRCKAQALTASQVKSQGIEPITHDVPDIAHKDFAYNPIKTNQINEKLKTKLSPKEYATHQKQEGDRDVLFTQIQTLFSIKDTKIVLCESAIFGDKKKVLLSSDTVESHSIKHPEITAFDYSLIPQMLEGEIRVFKQKENVFVLLKRLGKDYRLALKTVKDTDEIFATSLVFVRSYEKELKSLMKYKEIEE